MSEAHLCGLAAKPILDVDIVVIAAALPDARAALTRSGYRYEGEQGIPGRHAFAAPDDHPRRHVYLGLAGCLALRNHLVVRDVLRSDPELREEYARVKLALARRDLPDIDAYVAGKNDILKKVLKAGGITDIELETVARSNPSQ